VKTYCIILFFLSSLCLEAQDGMRNWGMLKIHADGGLGLHGNLINDGIFDDNEGLMGFYSDAPVSVSGSFAPLFNDMEILASTGLFLDITIGVTNNGNFMDGDIRTTRANSFVTLDFGADAFHTGATDMSKVDGYVSVQGKQNFTFPIGDTEQLRPLILKSEAVNPTALCAYFYEDPNTPTTFSETFNTNTKAMGLGNVCTQEFWHLEGSIPSTVQISWNERSGISLLTTNIEQITVVGWNKLDYQWENLGGMAVGDFSQGMVVSDTFDPNVYEILTFGTADNPNFIVDLPNYLITPNGDGINDFLEIDALEQSPNNRMRIYDRNGLLVFEQTNYTNGFNGYATDGKWVINRNRGLPSGVYFYLLTMDDLDLEFQGFLYLARD